jgi:hypothetical protein
VKLFSSRQTYSLIFLWVLTWFLYGIFMKGQVNVLNILGAAISATLIAFSYFLPFPIAITAKKPIVPQTKKLTLTQTQPNSQVNSKLSNSSTPQTSPCTNQVKKSPKQVTPPIRQEQKRQPMQLAEKPQESPKITPPYRQDQKRQPMQLAEKPQESPKSNGCPKNLDYFTKKPRPKLTPDECITCKNLITCVCLTSN